jgi:glycosyltransferase involved in cell wall biosynthesis
MRIGIAKPDWKIVGGFERLLARVASELGARGHDVKWFEVDVAGVDPNPFGVVPPQEARARLRDAITYFGLVEAFRSTDVSGVDLVLSSQPPSFAVDHPRQVALFCHHARIYYDLSDAWVRAGFVDAQDHAAAEAAVRRIDRPHLANVRRFLAAAEEVQVRLARYNGFVDSVGLYHPGSDFAERLLAEAPGREFGAPLCVTRHEFPKRAELFVQAMHELPETRGICVGTGGRLPFARHVDELLPMGLAARDADAKSLWLNRGEVDSAVPAAIATPGGCVDFRGFVPDDELVRLYSSALCVVAPALLEDYGLTAIEAMASGKPLVVCEDGGGLTWFVEDGVTGFVVEPTGPAIAAAIRRLVEDPALAAELGRNARERARNYTWAHAMDEIELGLRVALD